jgi:hypothetical protein
MKAFALSLTEAIVGLPSICLEKKEFWSFLAGRGGAAAWRGVC